MVRRVTNLSDLRTYMQAVNVLELYIAQGNGFSFADLLFAQRYDLCRLLFIRVFDIFEANRWFVSEQFDFLWALPEMFWVGFEDQALYPNILVELVNDDQKFSGVCHTVT